MPYANTPVSECISEFLLFGLSYVCDADSQSVVLELETAE